MPSSLDFGDSVSRTDATDSPGLGWQVHSTCTSCCYDYRSKPSVALLPRAECDLIPQRNTSQLIRAALSGPALRMSNQTSWWLVPCLGSHTLMEAVPRLDKDPLNTISVSTHFAFLHLFWSNIILSTLHHTPGSFSPVAGSGKVPRKSDPMGWDPPDGFLSIFQMLSPLPPWEESRSVTQTWFPPALTPRSPPFSLTEGYTLL